MSGTEENDGFVRDSSQALGQISQRALYGDQSPLPGLTCVPTLASDCKQWFEQKWHLAKEAWALGSRLCHAQVASRQ